MVTHLPYKPRYMLLDLPRDVIRTVARFRLRVHTLRVETATWNCTSSPTCDYVRLMSRGSLGCGKSLIFTRQSGFTSMDQFLGYGRECFWGLYTLILALPHVLMLRFPSCSRTCNTMFLRHKARANI